MADLRTRSLLCVATGMVGCIAILGSCSSSGSNTGASGPAIVPENTPAAPTVETPPVPESVATPTAEDAPSSASDALALGVEGRTVQETQDLLNDFLGYTDSERGRISEDGIYGPNTMAAQESFERHAGLIIDGVATAADRNSLEQVVVDLEGDRAISTVSLGDESVYVEAWQKRLNSWITLLGDSADEIVVDGTFDGDTEAATLDFERASGLQVDGVVEPEDRAAIRSAIAEARAATNVTIVARGLTVDSTWLVRAFEVEEQYCLRFISGTTASERCTSTVGGDINTAFFVTIEDTKFSAGLANPNVAVAVLNTGEDNPQVVTRQIGDSITRAWATVVLERPLSVELVDVENDPVIEMRFVVPAIDRDTFGATLSIESESYTETFILDTCTFFASSNDSVVQGEIGDVTMLARVTNGTGTITINGAERGLVINATVESIEPNQGDDIGFVMNGILQEPTFGGESFRAIGTCG